MASLARSISKKKSSLEKCSASNPGAEDLALRAPTVPRGTFIPFCYYEAAANLSPTRYSTFGKIPEFKYCAVKVVKGGTAGRPRLRQRAYTAERRRALYSSTQNKMKILAVDGSKPSLKAVQLLVEHCDWYRHARSRLLRRPAAQAARMGAAVGKDQIERYYKEEVRRCSRLRARSSMPPAFRTSAHPGRPGGRGDRQARKRQALRPDLHRHARPQRARQGAHRLHRHERSCTFRTFLSCW